MGGRRGNAGTNDEYTYEKHGGDRQSLHASPPKAADPAEPKWTRARRQAGKDSRVRAEELQRAGADCASRDRIIN
jgi:hypothetical protein